MNINQQDYPIKDDEIDVIAFLSIFWNKKMLIFTITSVIAILSVIFSLSLQNKYISKALLIPSQEQDVLSSKIGSLSALTSIAGVSMPDAKANKSQEAIERIKSYEFFNKFFLPNIELQNLTAAKKWHKDNNVISYDSKLYNSDTDKWAMDKKTSKSLMPSTQQAYKIYREIVSVNKDKETSFVNISVKHLSPYIAKTWLELIIEQINESMRAADQNLAKKLISYLSDMQQTNNIQSIKEVTAALLEEQMKTLMLTSSDENYVYKTIEYPIAPEEKSEPSRAVICIIGTFLGFILSMIIAFIVNLRQTLLLRK